ncbi:hypothetical protein QE152_g30903 [Popillia japonica]|uniref:PHD-type domain-containing protein n=1 Tax=Popillia japonica TaxID=7064 RepID=A0AAW1JCW5_POPJA
MQAYLEEKEDKRQKKKVDEAKTIFFLKEKSSEPKISLAKKRRNCKSKREQQQQQGENMTEENDLCPVCRETGKDELWWRCRACGIWLHAACTEVSRPKDENLPQN